MFTDLHIASLKYVAPLEFVLKKQSKEYLRYFFPFKNNYLNEQFQKPNLFFGLHVDGCLQGFSMLRFHPEYEKPSFGYMVDEQYKNLGFGTLLFHYTLQFAKLNKISFIAKYETENLISQHILLDKFKSRIVSVNNNIITYE